MHSMHMEGTEEEQVVTTVRLPRAQHDALREQAQREHRTFSQELRRMIELYLIDEVKTP